LKVKTPCDLILRTGEESEEREARSGFLLWQSAYAEYYHINKFFPDVTLEDFDNAWAYFKHARRRRGL
jgi:tritrans,polycis-undecaprenyl-diphosphate synthase [geranylgeranyl-diphosphate specific]